MTSWDHRLVDGVRFTYRLTGHGWAEADIQIAGESARLTASYIGDALGDLVRGTLALARGEANVDVSWALEPGEFRWLLARRDDTSLDIQILRLRLRPEEARHGRTLDPVHEVLAATCDRHEFCEAIARGAQEVLEEHGLDGYRDRWNQLEFPTETLAQLLALG
jgi:hypothetical protein